MGTRWQVSIRRRTRSLRQSHKFGTGLARCRNPLPERNPYAPAAVDEVQSGRIQPRHAPCPRWRTSKLRRVKSDRIGMIAVHMSDDIGLRGQKRFSPRDIVQQLFAAQVHDPSEPADIVGALGTHAPEAEIGKSRIHLRIGLPRQEPLADMVERTSSNLLNMADGDGTSARQTRCGQESVSDQSRDARDRKQGRGLGSI